MQLNRLLKQWIKRVAHFFSLPFTLRSVSHTNIREQLNASPSSPNESRPKFLNKEKCVSLKHIYRANHTPHSHSLHSFLPFLFLFLLVVSPRRLPGHNVIERIQQYFRSQYLMRIHWPFVMVNDSLLQFQHIEDGVAGNLAEYGVLVLQFHCFAQCEKELGCVVISTRIGHGHQAATREPQPAVEFIFERTAVDLIKSPANGEKDYWTVRKLSRK